VGTRVWDSHGSQADYTYTLNYCCLSGRYQADSDQAAHSLYMGERLRDVPGEPEGQAGQGGGASHTEAPVAVYANPSDHGAREADGESEGEATDKSQTGAPKTSVTEDTVEVKQSTTNIWGLERRHESRVPPDVETTEAMMDFDGMPDSELVYLKAKLERELVKLRSSRKNLNNTIKNITDDMQAHYTRHGADVVINAHEGPRA